jgi:hypothetical protein
LGNRGKWWFAEQNLISLGHDIMDNYENTGKTILGYYFDYIYEHGEHSK